MNEKARHADARPVLEIQVGRETVEVWIDQEGIHFIHPSGESAQGHLAWDVALAMSLLPAGGGRVSASAA